MVRIKTAKETGNSSHIRMSKTDLGKQFIVLELDKLSLYLKNNIEKQQEEQNHISLTKNKNIDLKKLKKLISDDCDNPPTSYMDSVRKHFLKSYTANDIIDWNSVPLDVYDLILVSVKNRDKKLYDIMKK